MSATEIREVAKKDKKAGETPKTYGTLIRVSEAFAEAVKQAAGFEQISVADFADAHLLSVTKKRYRDQIVKTAKRLEGGDN